MALALIASPAMAQEVDHSHHGAMASPSDEVVDAEVGNEPPPPVPSDHAADRIYSADRMARAREELVAESRFTTLFFSFSCSSILSAYSRKARYSFSPVPRL